MVKYIPERGDVVWLDFEPPQGKEIKKRQPALILTLKKYNAKVGLALVVPITSKQKGYPFETSFTHIKMGSGAILADQVRSLDWRKRRAEKITRFAAVIVKDVLAKTRVLLD